MKISTKGRYALRMLIDLAEHRGEGFISLRDVAERQEISKKYLEQIIPVFHRANVLRTNRGAQGGYMLARDPADYTVGEILRLTEGSLSPVDCMEREPMGCQRAATCPTLPVWQGLEKVINDYLDAITLQALVEQQRALYANDYVI